MTRDSGITWLAQGSEEIPIYLNEFIPLRMTTYVETEHYESMEIERDRLCMHFRGAIYVHPDRWDLFKTLMGEKDVRDR